jgi:hypothetical protein
MFRWWTRLRGWLIRKLEGKRVGLTATNQGDGYLVEVALKYAQDDSGNGAFIFCERSTGKRLLFAADHEATVFEMLIDQERAVANVRLTLGSIPIEFVTLNQR